VTEIRIGISGWRYPPWRGAFYPEDLPQREELRFAAGRLRTIELNGSFYSLQSPKSYRAWREETPAGFVFSVKGSRFITHLRRLREVEVPLANFFASGVLELAEKLGPFLWQFPEQFSYDPDRFESFFELLPRDVAGAVKLAQRHDARLEGRTGIPAPSARRLRHAVEIRSHGFANAEFVDQLRRHDLALVVADTAGKWPQLEDVTSDFMYLRLHGDEALYKSGYTAKALELWASRIRAWAAGSEPADARHASPRAARKSKGRDVFVYFDNDLKVRSPADAMALARLLGVEPDTAPLEPDAVPAKRKSRPRVKRSKA
jgi:uncharacterized protein YecE (DUF72 family)